MASPEEQQSTAVAVAALRQLRDDPEPAVARAARLALTRLPLTPDGGAAADPRRGLSDGQTALTVPLPIADDARAVLRGGVGEIDAQRRRGPISAPMVAALENACASIRARHPQVLAVVLVLGAGAIGAAAGLKLGHFAAMRWADLDQPATEARRRMGWPWGCRRCLWAGKGSPVARPMCSGRCCTRPPTPWPTSAA